MSKRTISILLLVALGVGFLMLPTDPVASSYYFDCRYTEAQRAALKDRARMLSDLNKKYYGTKQSGDIFELDTGTTRPRRESDDEPSVPTTYSASVAKSGLRKSIEGRLQWLGFDVDLAFLDRNSCDER